MIDVGSTNRPFPEIVKGVTGNGRHMRFIEYILAAILGSNGIATAEPTSPATRTLTADAITQPRGGIEGSSGQKKPARNGSQQSIKKLGGSHGDDTPTERARTRRTHKGRHAKLATSRPRVGSATGGGGGAGKRSASQQPPPSRPRVNPNSNKNSK